MKKATVINFQNFNPRTDGRTTVDIRLDITDTKFVHNNTGGAILVNGALLSDAINKALADACSEAPLADQPPATPFPKESLKERVDTLLNLRAVQAEVNQRLHKINSQLCKLDEELAPLLDKFLADDRGLPAAIGYRDHILILADEWWDRRVGDRIQVIPVQDSLT